MRWSFLQAVLRGHAFHVSATERERRNLVLRRRRGMLACDGRKQGKGYADLRLTSRTDRCSGKTHHFYGQVSPENTRQDTVLQGMHAMLCSWNDADISIIAAEVTNKSFRRKASKRTNSAHFEMLMSLASSTLQCCSIRALIRKRRSSCTWGNSQEGYYP